MIVKSVFLKVKGGIKMYKNIEIETKEEDYQGQEMTWKEAVKLFPDRWVGFSNPIFDGATLISGIFQFACIDKEMSSRKLELMKQGYKIYSQRTTELPGGALWL